MVACAESHVWGCATQLTFHVQTLPPKIARPERQWRLLQGLLACDRATQLTFEIAIGAIAVASTMVAGIESRYTVPL